MKDLELKQLSAAEVAGGNAFDLANLRLPQNYQSLAGVRKVRETVRVRKPNKQEFVRVHPGTEWRYPTFTLRLKSPAEDYLVAPELWDGLARELTPSELVLACNTFGDAFIWPLRLPGDDGRLDSWSESARAAAIRAETQFIRLIPNMRQSAYDLVESQDPMPEPEWPPESFESLLQLAFKGCYIDTLGHPIVRQLQGRQS